MAGGLTDTPAGAHAAGNAPVFTSSFVIRPGHVRALLWLRWRLTVRRFTRSWQRAIGMIFGLLFVLWMGASLGALTTAGYLLLPRPAATQILFGVLALVYIVWAVLPLLQYTLNEGLDVTKLQTYPITRGEQMVSLVLATMFDISSLFILAIFVAVLIGWHTTVLAAILTVVALGLAYFHIIGLSQLILAALMGLLRSRRYSDLTVVFFALVGSSCWLINQFVFSRLDLTVRSTSAADIAALHIDTYAQWLPTGMAARVISLADVGNYLGALPWLLAMAALVPVVLYIWARVLEHGLTVAETAGGGGRRAVEQRALPPAPEIAAERQRASGMGETARRGSLLPVPVRAIAEKDLKLLWRDPQLKAALLGTLIPILLVFLPGLFGGGRDAHDTLQSSGSAPIGVLFAPLPALLIVLILSLNAFGLERQGLQMMFLFPVKPVYIFLGKNLVVGGIAVMMEIVLTLAKAAITGGWGYVPGALCGGVAGVLVMLGCGNVTSVLAPFPSRQMRMGDTSSMNAEGGCLRSVISLLILGVTVLLLAPVAAAVIVPQVMSRPGLLVVTIPLALVYGVVVYAVPTRIMSTVLLARVPEIMAVTIREA